jgi:hypothetical protein
MSGKKDKGKGRKNYLQKLVGKKAASNLQSMMEFKTMKYLILNSLNLIK